MPLSVMPIGILWTADRTAAASNVALGHPGKGLLPTALK